jgi:2-polyprenyl-3-methyl-5-hydroxy-6-metoxy-1,4-benzoquinol methylase
MALPTVQEYEPVNSQPARYYDQERPEVRSAVPTSARRVIDVGCANGRLGARLKAERPGIEVRGIEVVAEAAQRARSVLDDAIHATAEQELPEHWPAPDCVIFADVLEHLVDPWAVVRTWRKRLADRGTLVVTIPNVLHRSVVLGVLRGRWDYASEGILDRTHLRFFTRETAVAMLESGGFRVRSVRRLLDLAGMPGVMRPLVHAWTRMEERRPVSGMRRKLLDLYTAQFLITAD